MTNKIKRKNISQKIKNEILIKQNFKCANIPGVHIRYLSNFSCPLWTRSNGDLEKISDTPSEYAYNIDHIVEHSISSDNNISNLCALCISCHYIKTRNYLNVLDYSKKKSYEVQVPTCHFNLYEYTESDNLTIFSKSEYYPGRFIINKNNVDPFLNSIINGEQKNYILYEEKNSIFKLYFNIKYADRKVLRSIIELIDRKIKKYFSLICDSDKNKYCNFIYLNNINNKKGRLFYPLLLINNEFHSFIINKINKSSCCLDTKIINTNYIKLPCQYKNHIVCEYVDYEITRFTDIIGSEINLYKYCMSYIKILPSDKKCVKLCSYQEYIDDADYKQNTKDDSPDSLITKYSEDLYAKVKTKMDNISYDKLSTMLTEIISEYNSSGIFEKNKLCQTIECCKSVLGLAEHKENLTQDEYAIYKIGFVCRRLKINTISDLLLSTIKNFNNFYGLMRSFYFFSKSEPLQSPKHYDKFFNTKVKIIKKFFDLYCGGNIYNTENIIVSNRINSNVLKWYNSKRDTIETVFRVCTKEITDSFGIITFFKKIFTKFFVLLNIKHKHNIVSDTYVLNINMFDYFELFLLSNRTNSFVNNIFMAHSNKKCKFTCSHQFNTFGEILDRNNASHSIN
jgi:hypothetical protein